MTRTRTPTTEPGSSWWTDPCHKRSTPSTLKRKPPFSGAVWRIKEQYVHIKNTKMRIYLGEIVTQMDFAENFTALEFFKNIQGVHWAKNLVTIHTVVVYFLTEGVEGVQLCILITCRPAQHHHGLGHPEAPLAA